MAAPVNKRHPDARSAERLDKLALAAALPRPGRRVADMPQRGGRNWLGKNSGAGRHALRVCAPAVRFRTMLDRINDDMNGVQAAGRAMSLEELDAWLSSEEAPPGCMLLSDLDGFLTGIVVGPDFIAPSEWLPAIWGGEAPEFADAGQAQAVLGAIMGRYNEVVRQIANDTFQPILWRFAETGTVIADDWAQGFAQAIALRPGRWTKMVESEAALLLIPIMVLCETDAILDELDLSDEDLDQTVEEAIDVLPATVLAIADYWQMSPAGHGKLGAYPRTAAKIGRNNPCPCGSGKKFKKCCGFDA